MGNDKASFSEGGKKMKWESFIDNLTAGEIIPIIGNDLSRVKDDNGEPIPLYEYIARQLTRRLGIAYAGQTISQLALEHPNENIPSTANTIYNKIDTDRFLTGPLEKLAGITDFNFYISTALDNLLVKALEKVRIGEGGTGSEGSGGTNVKATVTLSANTDVNINVIDYSLQQLSGAPVDEEENPPITVFNILGSFGNVTESAFDDEEMLEHFLSITNKTSNHPMARYFLEQVKGKILLFIGCDFPDWFMRFIVRILTNQRYKFRRFNDYIVPGDSRHSPQLMDFLKSFNDNIVILDDKGEGNARAFVGQLYERWVECVENSPIQYDGTVFLSYNHRDRDAVEQFKKLLRAKGIRNVWFDIDNLPSGEHQKAIEEEIKKCSVFIPIISANSLGHPESYTWKVEWRTIEFRLMADKFYGSVNFGIIPVIIDDTERGDNGIPEFMRAFTLWELEENKERVTEEIIKHLTPLKDWKRPGNKRDKDA